MKCSSPSLLYGWRNWCHTKEIPVDRHSINISKSLNCTLDVSSELGSLLPFKSIYNLWGHGCKRSFYFSSKGAVKPIFKRLLDSWKAHWSTYEITGCYRNVDYWTQNSCLQQWLHLLLQSTLQSSLTSKSYGAPLLLATGFQTKKINPQ